MKSPLIDDSLSNNVIMQPLNLLSTESITPALIITQNPGSGLNTILDPKEDQDCTMLSRISSYSLSVSFLQKVC